MTRRERTPGHPDRASSDSLDRQRSPSGSWLFREEQTCLPAGAPLLRVQHALDDTPRSLTNRPWGWSVGDQRHMRSEATPKMPL
jgi:hypothetical protein